MHKFISLQEKSKGGKRGIRYLYKRGFTSLKVTQAFLPVKVNYTPMSESKNTDKNVCATTDPQKQAQVKELEKQIDQLVV
ncbi:hypothetical protein THC_0226 [Caldimicrobium thiodismutans]|jgi:hypothetical protein|uniref:Uncharacterized protein n=1 Tax=Caldimicrobium thiodismutans TaxID=1653476 RepID=A0A0U5AL51_9BACT|nr:hypothetical protein [Caldimicrobium thiodismutans]BAU22626.1 hypothetical protein THC_0226 [Caldimicrobium thiodismutans]